MSILIYFIVLLDFDCQYDALYALHHILTLIYALFTLYLYCVFIRENTIWTRMPIYYANYFIAVKLYMMILAIIIILGAKDNLEIDYLLYVLIWMTVFSFFAIWYTWIHLKMTRKLFEDSLKLKWVLYGISSKFYPNIIYKMLSKPQIVDRLYILIHNSYHWYYITKTGVINY